eukprot:CAMPEP_0203862548 /NCGR_PEP_ID=MMETSP0359-20131031/13648_1 /ASSEMBLY_ACC=CAM_ASM_000338 /TAXON_ID=268821 /ORGANISM="Scrippsiella Hangoei, Strain SHTV-5" /LENGTH=446 /DNA_ID=CAMNT_0050779949 /DNA_START=18 /DNA_END=1358 /DNA_ORIENTATION=-
MAGLSQRAHRVLFLDVDGVLNSSTSDWSSMPAGAPAPLDADLLARLRRLLRASGSRVVFSSAWRASPKALDALMGECRRAGIKSCVFVGQTPEFRRSQHGQAACRVLEIASWLASNRIRLGVEQFAALDDLPLARACRDLVQNEWVKGDLAVALRTFDRNIVQTNPTLGLQDEDLQRTMHVLGLPTAFDAAAAAPRALPSSPSGRRRAGIVLDIDGTLIDSMHVSEIEASLGSGVVPVHEDEDGDCIFPRPHLAAFLDFCFSRFDSVGIWTASSEEWATTVIHRVLGHDRPWAFVWPGPRCCQRLVGPGGDTWEPRRLSTCKPLRKVWSSPARRAAGFTRRGTLILEDTSENCFQNRGNAVIVPSFSVARSWDRSKGCAQDDILLRLIPYLEAAVASIPDVRQRLGGQDGWSALPQRTCEASLDEVCPVCEGSGRLLNDPCPLCTD